jgi:hypothetical protein
MKTGHRAQQDLADDVDNTIDVDVTSGVVVNLDLGERCHSVLLSGKSPAKTGENFENTCELHRHCTPPLVASSEKLLCDFATS